MVFKYFYVINVKKKKWKEIKLSLVFSAWSLLINQFQRPTAKPSLHKGLCHISILRIGLVLSLMPGRVAQSIARLNSNKECRFKLSLICYK